MLLLRAPFCLDARRVYSSFFYDPSAQPLPPPPPPPPSTALFSHFPLSLPVSPTLASRPPVLVPCSFFASCNFKGNFIVYKHLLLSATYFTVSHIKTKKHKKKKKQAMTFRFRAPGMCCCYREPFNSWKSQKFVTCRNDKGILIHRAIHGVTMT